VLQSRLHWRSQSGGLAGLSFALAGSAAGYYGCSALSRVRLLCVFVADRLYFFLAPLTSVLVESSLEYDGFLFYKRHSDDPWFYLKMNWDITVSMAIYSLGTSLCIAYAIFKLRKA
jgi:hypothetical protein